jgi:predicted metalloprotease with PDZ domain
MRMLALAVVLASTTIAIVLRAQRGSIPSAAGAQSAAITDIKYEIEFNKTTARSRELHVAMHFGTAGRDPVLLSLPAWTPGAYEISNYARWVTAFEATGNGKPLTWDKLDYDTWRVLPNGATVITVAFNYAADSLDNAMAWARPDFVFFNGTNVLLYPEGRGTDFAATISIKTEPGWAVATGMASAGATRTYSAKNYHDLVDMPFFVGQFELDSTQVAGKWTRLATYPAGAFTGDARKQFWNDVSRFFPPEIKVTGEQPYDTYTIEIVFDSSYTGGSALEHQNSHMGIYTPFIIGNPTLASITAHEVFHLWNVKRMRPAEMMPYRYDRAQPTPWLWVSEGITDYYSDLALVRGGVIDSSGFLNLTNTKMSNVAALPPTSLQDASLSTWIHMADGTEYIYYDKGSLAGFLLDIMIRDASDNKSSLDDVMRQVYTAAYKAGRGFTGEDWWGAVSRAAGGKSFADFNAKYVDGRDPFPWASAISLAGFRLRADTIREPRVGVFTQGDSAGVLVTQIEPGGAADEAGIKPGDILEQIGEIPVNDATFGARFRQRYGRAEGEAVPVTVKRGGQTMALSMRIRISVRVQESMGFDANASPKAIRIRKGILTGTSG